MERAEKVGGNGGFFKGFSSSVQTPPHWHRGTSHLGTACKSWYYLHMGFHFRSCNNDIHQISRLQRLLLPQNSLKDSALGRRVRLGEPLTPRLLITPTQRDTERWCRTGHSLQEPGRDVRANEGECQIASQKYHYKKVSVLQF